MSTADQMRALLSQRRRGYSLPQGLYLDPAAYELDRRIARPGDSITLNVGGSSILVLRRLDGP